MTTYPEMNEQIVEILRFRGDQPSLYAAGRIEELETEVEQLKTTREEQAETIHHLQSRAGSASYETQKLLEQAQRAEAAMQEAVAQDYDNRPWAKNDLYDCLKAEFAAARTKQIASLEIQVADLRGTLQAALLPLERAADALVPEARAEEAARLVEEALVAIREELE